MSNDKEEKKCPTHLEEEDILKEANSFNSLNSFNRNDSAFHTFNSVEHFIASIEKERARPVSIYVRPTVLSAARRFLVLRAPHENLPLSLNRFIEDFLINFICESIEALNAEAYAPEPRVIETKHDTPESKNESKPALSCYIHNCKAEAICLLKNPKSGKTYPVCATHKERCLEAGWLLL